MCLWFLDSFHFVWMEEALAIGCNGNLREICLFLDSNVLVLLYMPVDPLAPVFVTSQNLRSLPTRLNRLFDAPNVCLLIVPV